MSRRSATMTRAIAATYATRLRTIRDALGLSQGALATRLGVLANQVSRYERAIQDIPEPTMRLAESLLAAHAGRRTQSTP